jgi:alkylation response protein AidB-like acyl-CoA dehydrogenase
VRREVLDWITDEWDPELTVGMWWERMAAARFTVPHWPEEWHGRGWSRRNASVVHRTLREAGVPGPPAGLGTMLAGPTILEHGSDDQKRRYLSDIVNGSSNWCQLFSEPGAGSDLVSLRTRAERIEQSWEITGQKVWTSNGQLADFGMLLARSDPNAPPRQGITWFILSMDQPSIEVRTLREMTGRSLFTEVFIDGARIRDEDIVGRLHGGWPVARTTLMNERMGLGGGGGAVGAMPGSRGGMLIRRAGDVVTKAGGPSSGTALAMRGRSFDELAELAKSLDSPPPVLRDHLAQLYTLERIAQLSLERTQIEGTGGRLAQSAGSIGKLMSTRCTVLGREIGMGLLGARGMLWERDRSPSGVVQEQCLFSPAVSIYGGTDQVQRNIIAERVLDLPRD